MALRESYMVKHLTDALGGQLMADPGQSLLIKDIYCLPSELDDFLTIRVDKVLVGFYRVKGKSGNHQAYPNERRPNPSLMGYLADKGLNPFIPVGEGQTLNVVRADEPGDVTLCYEIHDAGDITPAMPNGSASPEYLFINYVSNLSAIAADGESLLDKSVCPAEFPEFPIVKDVPAKTTIEILGIVGSPVGFSGVTGENTGETQFLKFVRGRDTLHDEDRAGLMFEGEDLAADGTEYTPVASVIGALTVDELEEPFWLPEALVFEAGEELNVYVTIKGFAGTGIPADTIDVAFVERIIKVG
ncbi:hypothetical protein ES705_13610 [subsurface metagenome]